MNTEDITTEEIEAPAYLDDPKVLTYLDGTDADLGRLVLEDDGKLWAYSKRDPGALCALCLLDMVTLAFPRYAPPAASPEALQASEPIPATPTPAKRPRRAALPFPIPKTGTSKSLLLTGGSTLPRIWINGVKRVPPMPDTSGPLTKVALQDSKGVLAGYAVLPTIDYCKLTNTPEIRADTLLWSMTEGGEVTTRVRGSPGDPYVQPVDALLAELGIEARVSLSEAA